MKRGQILTGVIGMVLALSACGNDEPSEPSAQEATASADPTPTATVTETVEAEPECEIPNPLSTRLIAESWLIVVASKGAGDHGRYVQGFADEVEELVEDFEDGGCSETRAMVLVTEMNYEATLVSFPHDISPPGPDAEDRHYDAVARLGNELFDFMEIEDAQFIPISCVGHVEETAECTALTA